jgi:hypothetical protein
MEKFKADAYGMYSTSSLYAHMLYISMMLCHLFGKKTLHISQLSG